MILDYFSNNNIIKGNIIKMNKNNGIYLFESLFNNITCNRISLNNLYGIYLDFSSSNSIEKNNFFLNKKSAFFRDSKNYWNQNYWNRPRILPKIIFGTLEIGPKTIPWFNIDWRPTRKPNDIGSDII